MRKGIGYIIESFVAILTLFVFAIGSQGAGQPQDWSSYELRIEAQDLTEVIETTGGLDALERGEVGTVRTFARHVSGDDLAVSGTAEIPIQEFSVAFPVLSDQKQVDNLDPVQPGDRCHNRLRDINKDPGTDTLKPEDDLYNARLYVADTDPRVAGGGNGLADYDTVYVDNKTRCQFTPSEGPFYINDYFNYSNRTAGARFQFKNVTGSTGSRELIYHNASQVLRLRQPTRRQMNGVETLVSFDTVNLTKASLTDYQLIVFRRNDSLTHMDDEKNRLGAFADRGGSLLLLMNLEDNDFSNNDLLSSSDLSYISDMDTTGRGEIGFSNSSSSRSLKQFFKGVSGGASVPELEPAGNISSTGDSGTAEQPLLSYKNTYERDDWNASNFSMTNAGTVPDGAPESECYPPPSDSLTEGSLQFPDDDSATSYDILNAELGSSTNFCQNNDLRSLMVDFNNNGLFEPQEGEGQFVEGDTLEWQGRKYSPEFTGVDGESTELVFDGSTNQEAINYIPSYGEGRLAATGYSTEYGSETRNLLAATMYQLLPENSAFGPGSSSSSLEVLSSTNQSFYMPYITNLRWSKD